MADLWAGQTFRSGAALHVNRLAAMCTSKHPVRLGRLTPLSGRTGWSSPSLWRPHARASTLRNGPGGSSRTPGSFPRNGRGGCGSIAGNSARSETMRSIRVQDTPQALATFPAESRSGSMNSSRSISPGCMGGGVADHKGFLMVVDDFQSPAQRPSGESRRATGR
jgi:hypothetical protein